MIDSPTGAPADYAELYEHYFGAMKAMVAKAGIHSHNVEDVAMDILSKFMEKDALAQYDPGKLFDVGERPKFAGPRHRPARFASYLRRFVFLYVKQHLDAQAVQDRKRAHVRPQDDSSAEEMIELRANKSTDPTTAIEIMSTIQGILETSEDAWILRKQSELQFLRSREALKAAIALADNGTRVSGAAVAEYLGWPTSVGVQALKSIREELRTALYGEAQTA